MFKYIIGNPNKQKSGIYLPNYKKINNFKGKHEEYVAKVKDILPEPETMKFDDIFKPKYIFFEKKK